MAFELKICRPQPHMRFFRLPVQQIDDGVMPAHDCPPTASATGSAHAIGRMNIHPKKLWPKLQLHRLGPPTWLWWGIKRVGQGITGRLHLLCVLVGAGDLGQFVGSRQTSACPLGPLCHPSPPESAPCGLPCSTEDWEVEKGPRGFFGSSQESSTDGAWWSEYAAMLRGPGDGALHEVVPEALPAGLCRGGHIVPSYAPRGCGGGGGRGRRSQAGALKQRSM